MDNLQSMYDQVYSPMVRSKIAIELDEEEMLKLDERITDNEDESTGRKAKYIPTHPESAFFVDEVCWNTSQQCDGNVGGQKFIVHEAHWALLQSFYVDCHFMVWIKKMKMQMNKAELWKDTGMWSSSGSSHQAKGLLPSKWNWTDLAVMASWFKRPGDKAPPSSKVDLLKWYYCTCNRSEQEQTRLKEGEQPIIDDDDDVLAIPDLSSSSGSGTENNGTPDLSIGGGSAGSGRGSGSTVVEANNGGL